MYEYSYMSLVLLGTRFMVMFDASACSICILVYHLYKQLLDQYICENKSNDEKQYIYKDRFERHHCSKFISQFIP